MGVIYKNMRPTLAIGCSELRKRIFPAVLTLKAHIGREFLAKAAATTSIPNKHQRPI